MVEIEVFPPDPQSMAISYMFKTPTTVVSLSFSSKDCICDISSQADVEIPLLRGIKVKVEELYVNGRPRHHLPSARDLEWHPDDLEQSSIFVVDYTTFSKMHPSQIQAVFRHRHILVVDTPFPEEPFDMSTLCQLRDPRRNQEMQGECSCEPYYSCSSGTHRYVDAS